MSKMAALAKVRPLYDNCSVSFVKRLLRLDTIDEWDRRYSQATIASVTKLFFPDTVAARKIMRDIGLDGVFMVNTVECFLKL